MVLVQESVRKITNELAFSKSSNKHLKTLKQYVPVVARVHGGTHPEFHEVRKLFDAIYEKTKKSSSVKPELADEFAQLREMTNHYTVPNDVCESYEAVYNLLAELDEAYHAQ